MKLFLYKLFECDRIFCVIILIVCKANIVRSYMAEGILREKLRKANKNDVRVLSAGLIDMQGAPADPTAEQLLREAGFQFPGHQSKLLDGDMVEKADLILVMESSQKEALLDAYPQVSSKVHPLKIFSEDYNGVDIDIRDPYRQSIFIYRLCFSEIYLAIDGLLKSI